MSNATRPAVRVERTIAAPPHDVYRAWLDPELLRLWLAPGDVEVSRAETEGHVGGAYRIWHTQAGSDVGGFDSELIEVAVDQRLVFRWGFVGPDRDKTPKFDSLLTVTFDDTSDGMTRLTLVHEQLDDLAAALPEVADNVQIGWEIVLDNLIDVLARGK